MDQTLKSAVPQLKLQKNIQGLHVMLRQPATG
jgi:hypothetical protein